jgi:uncharacterized membrane protein YeiH
MSEPPLVSLLLTTAEAVATIAFALSGLLEAARKRLDAVGVCMVAGLAAFGGGTLRDVLLDRRPFFWVEHAAWLWVLMGVITATFGGVLRDIVCNQIPSAFSDHRPYAVCAFIGGWVLVAAQGLGLPDSGGLLAAAATASGLRALALATDFRLPSWSEADDPGR